MFYLFNVSDSLLSGLFYSSQFLFVLGILYVQLFASASPFLSLLLYFKAPDFINPICFSSAKCGNGLSFKNQFV